MWLRQRTAVPLRWGDRAYGDGPLHPGDAGRDPDESAPGAKAASDPAQAGAADNWRRVMKQLGFRISRTPS